MSSRIQLHNKSTCITGLGFVLILYNIIALTVLFILFYTLKSIFCRDLEVLAWVPRGFTSQSCQPQYAYLLFIPSVSDYSFPKNNLMPHHSFSDQARFLPLVFQSNTLLKAVTVFVTFFCKFMSFQVFVPHSTSTKREGNMTFLYLSHLAHKKYIIHYCWIV